MSLVTVEATALKKAMNIAKSLVLSKTTIPVLQCVKLSIRNSQMEIEATNLEQAVKISIPANGQGAWLLNFEKFRAVLSAVPDGAMLGITGDAVATLESGKIKARIATLPVADFPDFSGKPDEDHLLFSMPAKQFASAISRVVNARLTDNSFNRLGGLTGIHLVSKGKSILFEGCNSHSFQRLVCEASLQKDFNFILPHDVVAAITAITDHDEQVSVYRKDGPVLIESMGTVLSTKLIDAEYPAIDNYICRYMSDGAASLFDVEILSRAVKAAMGIDMGNKDNIAVCLKANAQGSFVTGYGDGAELLAVPVECECGDEFEAWVKPQYLLEVLASIEAETIPFKVAGGALVMPEAVNGFFGMVMQRAARATLKEAA